LSLWSDVENLQKKKAELEDQLVSLEERSKILEQQLKNHEERMQMLTEQFKVLNEAMEKLESAVIDLVKKLKKPEKEPEIPIVVTK
jgi:chromosome segregation ATPase